MSEPASYLPVDLEVRRIVDVTASVRRVTLAGPGVAGVAPLCLDRRLKLVLPRTPDDSWPEIPRTGDWYAAWRGLDENQRPPLRTYTARDVRPQACEIDIDVVRHGASGPAGRWIENVRVGERLLVVAPNAAAPGVDEVGIAWRPGHAREVLVVGDETAAPAICNIVASLPTDARGTVLLETSGAIDAWQLAAPAGVEVRVLARDGQPHGSRLEAELRTLAWPPRCTHDESPCAGCGWRGAPATPTGDAPIWEEPPASADGEHFAWLAGESGAVTRMRRHLVGERGCPRERVAFMGYWKKGRAEC